MSPQKQTFFLIDGSHYDRLRSVFESPFDLRKLADIANGSVPVDQAIYYRDLRDDAEAERQRPLFGWLKHNGFSVKGRTHGPGEPRERYGTNLVQIAVDALLLAEPGDHVMVFAGDAKLEPLMEQFGWRTAWLLNAGLVVAGVAIALLFLPRPGDKALRSRNDRSGDGSSTEPLWRDRRLLLTFPAMLAGPFVVTGFFFHQARLAEQKGWDISVVAASFAAFAIVQAVASVVVGPLIDKMGPKRLLPMFLLPQALAMLLIGFISVPWIAPVYMVLMAASMAFGATLATALWVDLFGAMELARIRSAVEAGTVIASGASPIIMGILIDAGIPLSWQALACCVYAVLASAATIGVMRTKSAQ